MLDIDDIKNLSNDELINDIDEFSIDISMLINEYSERYNNEDLTIEQQKRATNNILKRNAITLDSLQENFDINDKQLKNGLTKYIDSISNSNR
ncbi:hypothetical protein KKF61_08235 [Patescibacteria group bacterium]|nr:hypothetical protein [Patescibacteria group bacterium]